MSKDKQNTAGAKSEYVDSASQEEFRKIVTRDSVFDDCLDVASLKQKINPQARELGLMGALHGFVFCQDHYPRSIEELIGHFVLCENCLKRQIEWQNGELINEDFIEQLTKNGTLVWRFNLGSSCLALLKIDIDD